MIRGAADGPALDVSLAARAAWLSYVGRYTQDEIAERLSVSRIKVTRLIAQAHQRGIVRVFVEGSAADCVALEEMLASHYGLRFVSVATSLGDSELPLATLGNAAARFLHQTLERGNHSVIGVGHGRTLAAMVENLPRVPRPEVTFVSLLGSIVRNALASPFDIIQRLAERTGGEGYFMPVPFIADTAEDRRVLHAQRSLQPVFELAARAELCLIGIGEVSENSFIHRSGAVTLDEISRLRAAGAVGEVLGQFVDAAGRLLDIDLNQRSIGVTLADLAGKDAVGVAGGRGKVAAIDAVLRTKALTGLIIDEDTAQCLVARIDNQSSTPTVVEGITAAAR